MHSWPEESDLPEDPPVIPTAFGCPPEIPAMNGAGPKDAAASGAWCSALWRRERLGSSGWPRLPHPAKPVRERCRPRAAREGFNKADQSLSRLPRRREHL